MYTSNSIKQFIPRWATLCSTGNVLFMAAVPAYASGAKPKTTVTDGQRTTMECFVEKKKTTKSVAFKEQNYVALEDITQDSDYWRILCEIYVEDIGAMTGKALDKFEELMDELSHLDMI